MTTKEDKEGYHYLKAHTYDPQLKVSVWKEVTILIRGCIPGWDKIPGNPDYFSDAYQIGTPSQLFWLDEINNHYCSFSADFYLDTVGTPLPAIFDTY